MPMTNTKNVDTLLSSEKIELLSNASTIVESWAQACSNEFIDMKIAPKRIISTHIILDSNLIF